MPAPSWRTHGAAAFGYTLLALVATWPLPLYLQTHLTGPPSGDTGVYVWNTWVFAHEALSRGQFPFVTASILSLAPPIDLGLHNYTVFANLLAMPLQPALGIVGAFNVVYLLLVGLSGYATFLLVRHLTGRAAEAWLAGALFACSPQLIARGAAHFSLVAAAPLPIFLLCLVRCRETGQVRYAVATGATLAWAGFCDAYYTVYCLLLAGAYLAGCLLLVHRAPRGERPRPPLARALDLAVVVAGLVALGIAATGGGEAVVLGVRFGLRSLYTPVLLLTVLLVVRWVVAGGVRLRLHRPVPLGSALRLAGAAVLVGAVVFAPVLYAVGRRVAERGYDPPKVYWRSSPPGVDLLAYVAPNPHHPLWGGLTRAWLTAKPGGLVENVASLPWVALGVVVFAWRRGGYRLPGLWLGLTLGFALVSLGPFVRVGGFDSYVPTPWALLRYVPVVGAARSPSRLAVVATLGVAVLFGLALAHLGRRWPGRRRGLVLGVGAVLLVELLPAPRPLYAAYVPEIYRTIAADPRNLRVLELPFGIRDGASSLGNYSARSQFHQAFHGKRLVGGYLSRVPTWRKDFYRDKPVLDAILTLSEGGELSEAQAQRAWAERYDFLHEASLGYVVVDRKTSSDELRTFAIELLDLVKIGEDLPLELYRPRDPLRDP